MEQEHEQRWRTCFLRRHFFPVESSVVPAAQAFLHLTPTLHVFTCFRPSRSLPLLPALEHCTPPRFGHLEIV